MKSKELLSKIALGEDSTRQFKADIRNAESLASEMAAFANSEGGKIFIGVGDDRSLPGLDASDLTRINQLISNAASHLVRSPLTVRTENIAIEHGRVVIVVTVPKGIDKPYFDKLAGLPIWTTEGRLKGAGQEVRHHQKWRDLVEDWLGKTAGQLKGRVAAIVPDNGPVSRR